MTTKGEVKNSQNFDHVVYGWPLSTKTFLRCFVNWDFVLGAPCWHVVQNKELRGQIQSITSLRNRILLQRHLKNVKKNLKIYSVNLFPCLDKQNLVTNYLNHRVLFFVANVLQKSLKHFFTVRNNLKLILKMSFAEFKSKLYSSIVPIKV